MPASVVSRCEAHPDEALSFSGGRDTCHLVIALRQDYLAELLRLRHRLPALLDHPLELRGMTVEDATRV